MNARQKCKKLKRELKELKNTSLTNRIIRTTVPIDQYKVKCIISRDDPEFQAPEELQEEMVKAYFVNSYADLINKYFHITEVEETVEGKTYYMELWMGQEDRMRDATEEERKSTKRYIDSISRPTSIGFDEIIDKLSQVPEIYTVSLEELRRITNEVNNNSNED